MVRNVCDIISMSSANICINYFTFTNFVKKMLRFVGNDDKLLFFSKQIGAEESGSFNSLLVLPLSD